MAFVHHHNPRAKPAPGDQLLIIQGDRLLARLRPNEGVVFPDLASLPAWQETLPVPLHVGQIADAACWLSSVQSAATPAPTGWEWHETRSLLAEFTPAQLHAVSCARQLHWWQTRHRFCGCCGTPTIDSADERAKRCPSCNALFFPVTSPAVIVAITRGDKILLAHNRNFRAGVFSLLAGFVDPGETLEQATAREVKEEVGIEITDLRYVTSQPWPFPNSLMVGFRATHGGGEIVVDQKEIEQAGWFSRDAMPEIPRSGTVARLLINNWLSE